MKTKNIIIAISFLMLNIITLKAQTNAKAKLVLIEIDTKEIIGLAGYNSNEGSATEITRLELDKLEIYNMVNKYDLEYLINKENIQIKNCFSTYCISDIAQQLKCDKVFTGSISKVADKLIIIFRVYDTKSGEFEKQIVKEYLSLPLQLPAMIKYTLREMYGLPNSNEETKSMTDKFEFDETRNNPYKSLLRADGPRMGVTYFTGNTATLLNADKSEGGFNAQPMMFQFGYQFEKQYLNEGDFQALFEFLPMVTGLDQGLFIPSFTIMNGIRNNKNGWEFAFGPSFSLVSKSHGFYDNNKTWHLAADTAGLLDKPFLEQRLDSRGELKIQPSFIFAVGKTIKKGKLNMPINAYVIPSNDGVRYGISFGFNSRNRYESGR